MRCATELASRLLIGTDDLGARVLFFNLFAHREFVHPLREGERTTEGVMFGSLRFRGFWT